MTKYVSLDVETTALCPSRGQVLEIGAVVETDWSTPVDELPHLRLLLRREHVSGTPEVLAMNARLLEAIADPGAPAVWPHEAVQQLDDFLRRHFGDVTPTAAGKNVAGFDLPWLRSLPGGHRLKFRSRCIDPGVMWWIPALDATVPDLATCLARADIGIGRPHDALADARAVVRLVRAYHARREG